MRAPELELKVRVKISIWEALKLALLKRAGRKKPIQIEILQEAK